LGFSDHSDQAAVSVSLAQRILPAAKRLEFDGGALEADES
jgi:hypothetical protein